jgi:hypothetical protein
LADAEKTHIKRLTEHSITCRPSRVPDCVESLISAVAVISVFFREVDLFTYLVDPARKSMLFKKRGPPQPQLMTEPINKRCRMYVCNRSSPFFDLQKEERVSTDQRLVSSMCIDTIEGKTSWKTCTFLRRRGGPTIIIQWIPYTVRTE